MADQPRELQAGERKDFRQEVTNKLVEMLEQGTAPWQRPWDPEKAKLEMRFARRSDWQYRHDCENRVAMIT